MRAMMRESDLYGPVKAFLEAQGFEVKGEVGAVDVMALRGAEPPVIVELKRGMTLSLVHQAIRRLSVTDAVYIAVPKPGGRQARRALRDHVALCRRLGLGYLTVRADGVVEAQCDPGPYAPRKNKAAQAKLLREFGRLRGDPNDGGATRHGIVTAYRQDALACAAHLVAQGAARGRDVRDATGVKEATRLMRENHYGWFAKLGTGVFELTDAGRQGLKDWAGSWETD